MFMNSHGGSSSCFCLLPQKRLNITKTVRKAPINMEMQRVGAATDDSQKKKDPKYDHEERFVSGEKSKQG